MNTKSDNDSRNKKDANLAWKEELISIKVKLNN